MMRIPGLPETLELRLSSGWGTGSDIETEVKLGWSPEFLRVAFRVREPQIRSLETDPWLVHRDSCVEVFFKSPSAENYINMEANPSGVTLLASGPDRGNRQDLSRNAATLLGIEGSHLGKSPFDEKTGGTWTMEYSIRPGLAGLPAWTAGTVLELNLYKCGEALDTPHYLNRFPIDVPRPDFHRPEFFGKAILEG